MAEIKTKQELLDYLDEFIREISIHPGYESIFFIIENPGVILLSQITGFQPGYFGVPIDEGKYVKFDTEKIKGIRDDLAKALPDFP